MDEQKRDVEPTVTTGSPSIGLRRVKEPESLVEGGTYLVGESRPVGGINWFTATWEGTTRSQFMVIASGEILGGFALANVFADGYMFELPTNPNEIEQALFREPQA